MMTMVSSGDLMTLYMGLELQSLALYVVASLRRDNEMSTEAGLKYFVLGALSSGMLLYGASLTYGFAGTTQYAGIVAAATEGHLSLGLLIGLVMMIAGLAFKVSAVPFHMWTPDVYQARRPRSPRFSPPRPRLQPWVCLRGCCLTPLAAPCRIGARSSRFCRSFRWCLALSRPLVSAISNA